MTTDERVDGCYSCGRQALPSLPPRDDILQTDHWLAAHAFNSTLPGWLVLVPKRHITAFVELSPEAADELGGLVLRLSTALEKVTGCVKTYLMQFSEAEGFSHLHIHLVPRMADHPPDALGPRVFSYLSEDQAEWLSDADLDATALALRAALR